MFSLAEILLPFPRFTCAVETLKPVLSIWNHLSEIGASPSPHRNYPSSTFSPYPAPPPSSSTTTLPRYLEAVGLPQVCGVCTSRWMGREQKWGQAWAGEEVSDSGCWNLFTRSCSERIRGAGRAEGRQSFGEALCFLCLSHSGVRIKANECLISKDTT